MYVLRRSRAQLIDFFQNAPIALHWLSGTGHVLWANQTELDVLGYTAEEYIGQPIMKFCPDEEELVLPPLSFLHPTGRWQSVSVTLEDEPAPQRDAAAGRRNRKAETREVRFTVIEVKPTFEGSGERG